MNTHLSRAIRVAREVGGGVRWAACLRGRRLLALALAGFALTAGAARLDAQVYGVSRRTPVGADGRPVLPAGYLRVLPGGYRVVVVRGSRYYLAGGI